MTHLFFFFFPGFHGWISDIDDLLPRSGRLAGMGLGGGPLGRRLRMGRVHHREGHDVDVGTLTGGGDGAMGPWPEFFFGCVDEDSIYQ